MAQEHARIERDSEVMGGEPCILGRRVSVRQVAEHVEQGGMSPGEFAERFELDLADVYHALAYYHEHQDEMEEVYERRRKQEKEALRKYGDSSEK